MLSIIINGQTVEGSAQEIAELLKLVDSGAENSAAPAKSGKHAKSARQAIEQPKAKNEPKQLDIKPKFERMAERAIANAHDAHGIELKLEVSERYNKGKDDSFNWLWLRCTDGKLNRDNGKDVAKSMPKGWIYSPRRNAIRRDVNEDIRKGK